MTSKQASMGFLSGLVAVFAACAPAAKPVEGAVGEAIQAALDSGAASFGHAEWDRLLAEGTRSGLVDYRYFQESRPALEAYLDRLAGVDLSTLASAHLEALLMNAYNAYTIQSILDHPGVRSIRKIPGVWKDARHRVGGYELTLDEIEHNILRPFFRDPRIHFALNCASLSCAPLPPWAFDGDRLDEQLDERRRSFLADPRNVRADDGTLYLSSYFNWYGSDFTSEGWRGAATSMVDYVREGAGPEVVRLIDGQDGSPTVAFLDYDWALNAAVPPDPDVHAPASAGRTDPEDSGLVARLRNWVGGFGPLGPAVYGLVYAVLTVAFIPGSALTVGAGVAFGVAKGTLVVWLGATFGAAACFLLSRTLLRRRVERWVAGNKRFASLDRAVANEGWKIVALTRLSPVFPFNLLNYAFGLTGIGFWSYVLASWIAMLPGTLLYVYLGAAGAEVAEAATGAGSWGRTAIQVVGLSATVVVTVVITRVARRALKEAERRGETGEAVQPG